MIVRYIRFYNHERIQLKTGFCVVRTIWGGSHNLGCLWYLKAPRFEAGAFEFESSNLLKVPAL